MSILPEYLKQFERKAKQYLEEGLVRDIEFSGGTYQVQVIDLSTKKPVWAFLQLDNRGKIKDCFCSCEEGEEIHYCEHQAAAFLRIYNGYKSPLHHRFERSLWNCICRLFSDQLGSSVDVLTHSGKGVYVNDDLFKIKGKTSFAITHLDQIIEHRKKETEETSLKFSNLTMEEITQWREGHPSPQLSYELSFWNDIAKWLMRLEEEDNEYKIIFDEQLNRLPSKIIINFQEVEVSFALSESNLAQIIPSLETVKSPLKVHNTLKEQIKKIIYDKTRGYLKIIRHSKEPEKRNLLKKGIHFESWIYVYNDGFYTGGPDFFISFDEISGKELEQALSSYIQIVKELMPETPVHLDPIQLSYSITFDKEWNLHINSYAFHPEDLKSPYSKRFGEWVYLDGDGFYRLENIKFDNFETVIPAADVAAFVSQNRIWLNSHEGFQTHLSNIEAFLTYTVNDDNYLTFSRTLALHAEPIETKDFGRWVYISGHGFFSKVTMQTSLPIPPGLTLNATQIPIFIKTHREDLQLVPHFFMQECPVASSGLNIRLTDDEHIEILPVYTMLPAYQDKKVRFFDDIVYVENEGFLELPANLRLPEQYRQPVLIEPMKLGRFLTQELDSLRHFIKSIDPRLEMPQNMQLILSSIARIEGGFYSIKLKYQSEKAEIPLTRYWSELHKKKHFFFSAAGLISLEDRRFNWLKNLKKDRIDRRSNSVKLSTLELIRLNAFEDMQIKGNQKETAISKALLKELTDFRPPVEPDLNGLVSDLRPYQKLGVDWLWFLYNFNLSGLLCDDMGLGKTHQAMALFQAIYNHHHKQTETKRFHFLVVCPTSVIYHWQEKIQKYLPNLRVWTFYGIKRSLEKFYEECDILLTSYGIWRNETEVLSKLFFEVAVFDEIQIAKNQLSRIHSALLTANAQMRLGLTGTPIENRLRELKSLFDIVLPGYMPPESDYRDFFINPIEKENDELRKRLLSRLIKPFVLRRKKEAVLQDLPEKTEEISHCGLMPEQRQLYVDVLTTSRQKILEELENEKTPVPYIHIFALLSHLKQVCDHPAVYLKKAQNYKEYQSGKWDLFVELLNEARDSQQKVVVFSQYLGMLDIIESYLQEQEIGFAAIRGATVSRGEEVNRFNKDPNCEVFVGSLQAAGLGIDLTAGSVVIHYDRWWNAARENQATDRVHRIGQTRGVQVFKLMTKDTVEEHIDNLILKKGRLMEDIVSIDDHQLIKKFERQEIIRLLKLIPSI